MLAGLRVPSTLRAKPVRMTPAIGSAKRGESVGEVSDLAHAA